MLALYHVLGAGPKVGAAVNVGATVSCLMPVTEAVALLPATSKIVALAPWFDPSVSVTSEGNALAKPDPESLPVK